MIDIKNCDNELPYILTTGVTATRDGLEIAIYSLAMQFSIRHSAYGGYFIPWPDVAERLRYREGQPWCNLPGGIGLVCGSANIRPHPGNFAMHRLAAILCDDAEGFRVLHWCIEEFGDE